MASSSFSSLRAQQVPRKKRLAIRDTTTPSIPSHPSSHRMAYRELCVCDTCSPHALNRRITSANEWRSLHLSYSTLSTPSVPPRILVQATSHVRTGTLPYCTVLNCIVLQPEWSPSRWPPIFPRMPNALGLNHHDAFPSAPTPILLPDHRF